MDLFLALLLAASVENASAEQTGTAVIPVTSPSCKFNIIERAPDTINAVGDPEILSRLKVWRQADSPLAITGADFSRTAFGAGPGSAWTDKGYELEVRNISDVAIEGAHVVLRVGSAMGSSATAIS